MTIGKLILMVAAMVHLHPGTQAQEIFDAVRNNELGKIKELIEKNPGLISARNARQSTPLHVAAAMDNREIAGYLIGKDSDIDLPNGNFYTPLMFAGIQVAKLLVEKGADINYKSPYGWSAMAEALWRGKTDVADYLIDNGATIPEPLTPEGTNMLIAALKAGSVKYLEKCIQSGLSPAFESETGSNLLHFAAEGHSTELIKKLTDFGTAVDQTNIFGWTPLHTGAFCGNRSFVELLIQKGLDKNARTTDGKTPYNLAYEANMTDVMDFLVSIGADQSPQKFPALEGDYLGQPRPGKKPVPFAPGIVSAQYSYHTSPVFSADGNEVYWKSMQPACFMFSGKTDGKWSRPDTLGNMEFNDAPFISPDGNKFYFLALQLIPGQPPKELIQVMDKIPSGWSEPYPLPDIVNSIPGIHWQLSVDLKGDLFFGARQNGTANSRIYCSELTGGDYSTPVLFENLKDTDAHSPFIAPDGSYLIASTPTDGLLLLYKTEDGRWTKEISLTEILGITGHCPVVSHDGKYLFFLHNAGDKFIPYWADASFIEELRPKEEPNNNQ